MKRELEKKLKKEQEEKLKREFKEEKDILGILGKKKALGPNPLSMKKKIKIGGSIFFLFFRKLRTRHFIR